MSSSDKHMADVLATVRSPAAPVFRGTPTPCAHYSEYRNSLRWDFWYSCGYCTLTETEAAGVGFSIDHYLPQARYPELANEYSNLFWSCNHCNSFKRDYPTEAAALKGYRFYRPDMDDPAEHFQALEVNPTRIEHLSEKIGRYTIEQLYLNRQSLRRLREGRNRLFRSRELLVYGLRRLQGIRLDALPREVRTKFVQARKRLSKDAEVATEVVNDALLREFNRSEFLESASPTGHDATLRKQYLKKVNAALPQD